MKRLLLMMLLSASVVGAWAQEDYHPLLKEGKVWNEVAYVAPSSTYRAAASHRSRSGVCIFSKAKKWW